MSTVLQSATRTEILNRAADLLEEFGWCQWTPALDVDGFTVLPCDEEAVSFCMTGAVERAIFDLCDGWDCRKQGFPLGWTGRRPRKGARSPLNPAWNNAAERTKAEVVARLRALAVRAEKADA
jgi:hypothetical protein